MLSISAPSPGQTCLHPSLAVRPLLNAVLSVLLLLPASCGSGARQSQDTLVASDAGHADAVPDVTSVPDYSDGEGEGALVDFCSPNLFTEAKNGRCYVCNETGDGVTGAGQLIDDGDLCTDDLCDADTGVVHEFNSAACDDGDPLTSDDTCLDGVCVDPQLVVVDTGSPPDVPVEVATDPIPDRIREVIEPTSPEDVPVETEAFQDEGLSEPEVVDVEPEFRVSQIALEDVTDTEGNPYRLFRNSAELTRPQHTLRLSVNVSGAPEVTFRWSASHGTLDGQGPAVLWTAPDAPVHETVVVDIEVMVETPEGDSEVRSLAINVINSRATYYAVGERHVAFVCVEYPSVEEWVGWTLWTYERATGTLRSHGAEAGYSHGILALSGDDLYYQHSLGPPQIIHRRADTGEQRQVDLAALRSAWDLRSVTATGTHLAWAQANTTYEHVTLYYSDNNGDGEQRVATDVRFGIVMGPRRLYYTIYDRTPADPHFRTYAVDLGDGTIEEVLWAPDSELLQLDGSVLLYGRYGDPNYSVLDMSLGRQWILEGAAVGSLTQRLVDGVLWVVSKSDPEGEDIAGELRAYDLQTGTVRVFDMDELPDRTEIGGPDLCWRDDRYGPSGAELYCLDLPR